MGFKAQYLNGMITSDPTNLDIEPHEQGTTIILENLFFQNTKKKRFVQNNKFLKELEEMISFYAIHLVSHEITFTIQSKTVIKTFRHQSRADLLKDIFGLKKNTRVYELQDNLPGCNLSVNLLYVRPNDVKGHKRVILFINNRLVKYNLISNKITKAFSDVLMTVDEKLESYLVYLEIEIDKNLLDVNLSADKLTVRMIKEQQISSYIYSILISSLKETMNVKTFQSKKLDTKEIVQRYSMGESKRDKFKVRSDRRSVRLDNYIKKRDVSMLDESVDVISKSVHRNEKRIRTMPKEELDRVDSLPFDVSGLSAVKKERAVAKPQPMKVEERNDKNSMKIEPTNEAMAIIFDSVFIGTDSPFSMLIQNNDMLLRVYSFHIVRTFFNILMEAYFNEDSDEQFNSITIKMETLSLHQITSEIGHSIKITQELDEKFKEFVNNINFLPYVKWDINEGRIELLVWCELIPLIDHTCLCQLIFQLFMHHLHRNFDITKVFVKFFLFVLNKHGNTFFPHAKEVTDSIYRHIFFKLQKNKRLYKRCPLTNKDFETMMDIRSTYKLFERC